MNLDVAIKFPVEIEPATRNDCVGCVRDSLEEHFQLMGARAQLGIDHYGCESDSRVVATVSYANPDHLTGLFNTVGSALATFFNGEYRVELLDGLTQLAVPFKRIAA